MNGVQEKQIDSLARCLLDIVRKEGIMQGPYKRPVTKEQAEKIIHEGNWEGIFNMSEEWGYGVYGRELKQDKETGEYYVQYELGDSCD